MANEYTTIAAVLFKSKTLSNGDHPIMIRISKAGKRSYVSLSISCKVKDWDDKASLMKKSHPYKDEYDSIISTAKKEYTDKLIAFKQEGKDFTPAVLVTEASKKVQKITLFTYFDQIVKRFESSRQIGNSKVYKDTYNQLKKFTNNKDLTFSQVDYNFLIRFETYLKSNGGTDTGISVRFRTIRALYNAAIAEKYAKKDHYPFTKFKITERYSTKTKKRAINKEDIKKIEALELKKYSAIFEAQQYFLFSYYGQGINFVDMAHLKWENITDGRVYYERAKTGNQQNFKLSPPAIEILSHWKLRDNPSNNDYIFPILNREMHITPSQQHNRVHKVLTRVNRHLKTIAEDAKINVPLTSYVARHTYATVLKRSGVQTSVISQSMGIKLRPLRKHI